MNVSPWFEPSIGNLPSIMISTSLSVSRRYSLHIKSNGGTKISRGTGTGYQPDRLDAQHRLTELDHSIIRFISVKQGKTVNVPTID